MEFTVLSKKCCICKIYKPLIHKYFYKNKSTKSGFCSRCIECSKKYTRERYIKNKDKLNLQKREWYLRKKFGITNDEYWNIFMEQEGKCAICGQYPPTKRLVIDHDHKTEKIRKLICDKCNWTLGLINDNPFILIKMVKYLKGE